MAVRVQSEPFDLGVELNRLRGTTGSGALVSFTGIVRGGNDLLALELEHYPAMTEKALMQIDQLASERWGLIDSLIIHRFGRLNVGDDIMMVATNAPHRRAAFEAADFMMDYLKSRAPFWKKEHFADRSDWVDATEQDENALKRW